MYLQQNHLDQRTGKNNVFTTESSRSKEQARTMYLQQNHLDQRTGKNNVFTTESSRSKNR